MESPRGPPEEPEDLLMQQEEPGMATTTWHSEYSWDFGLDKAAAGRDFCNPKSDTVWTFLLNVNEKKMQRFSKLKPKFYSQ